MANHLDGIFRTLSEDENFETTTLIWLDSHLINSNEQTNNQEKLRSVVNHVKLFDSRNECEKYIQDLSQDDRIVLITSGQLGKGFLPCIHHFRQITSIYIFCMDSKKNELWTKDFLKVKGVFTDIDKLVKDLKSAQQTQTRSKINEPLGIKIFTTRDNVDQSTTALNENFVYHNLFLDSLLQLKPTSKDKSEFINRCTELYKNNPSQLIIIKEFNENYRPDKAIWWYTRETFLYRLLNKALRIQNIDLLFYFRFFIHDIQKQLEILQCSEQIEIYRAQLMSNDELNDLKNSINQYLSINSFFSTSRDKKYAIFLFGDKKSIPSDLHRVLFTINANPNSNGVKPFADISLQSYFPKESEVLIMSGAIFRLDDIYQDDDKMWIIHLSLYNDQDNDLKSRIDQIKGECIDQEISLLSFGRLLLQKKKYIDAEKYYRRLISQFDNDDKQRSLCYYQLGRVYSGRGKCEESIQWYEKALKAMKKTMNSNDTIIAECLYSMGNSYRKKEDYTNALDAYEEARNIWTNQFGDDHLKVSMCLINISVIYHVQENYTDALEYLEKALIIKKKCHGANHSDIAALYNNIGSVYQALENFELALENFQHALEIYQTPTYVNSINHAETLENIGYLYENKQQWEQASIYLKQAVDVCYSLGFFTNPEVIELQNYIEYLKSLIKN